MKHAPIKTEYCSSRFNCKSMISRYLDSYKPGNSFDIISFDITFRLLS